MAVSALQQERGRAPGLVVRKTAERVGSGRIGEVIFSATADVGYVDPKVECLFSGRVADDVSSIEVILGAPAVGLRASARESPRNNNLRRFMDARDWPIKVANQKAQLVHQPGRKQVAVTDIDFVLLVLDVVARLGENRTAHILIPVRLPFVRIPDP